MFSGKDLPNGGRKDRAENVGKLALQPSSKAWNILVVPKLVTVADLGNPPELSPQFRIRLCMERQHAPSSLRARFRIDCRDTVTRCKYDARVSINANY